MGCFKLGPRGRPAIDLSSIGPGRAVVSEALVHLVDAAAVGGGVAADHAEAAVVVAVHVTGRLPVQTWRQKTFINSH